MGKLFNLPSLRSESGSTLIQLMVGLFIMSIIGLAAAHVTAGAKQVEKKGYSSNSISQMHLIALQKSRNVAVLKRVLSKVVDLSNGSNLSKCLAGNGEPGFDCRTLNQAAYRALNETASGAHYASYRVQEEMNETVDGDGHTNYQNDLFYRITCSTATSCELVSLRVVTEFNNEDTSTTEMRRTTDLQLAGPVFGDIRDISFVCASADRFITAVDFGSRTALCSGIPMTVECNSPVTGMDAGSNPRCAAMANLNCGSGVRSIGLTQSQGSCL